jgi:hypothetical protein
VSLGPCHIFENQSQIQEELTFLLQVLSRQGSFLPPYLKLENRQTIPFMALNGLGMRNIVAEGESELSGKYIVLQEEVEGHQMRRLYFLNNPFVIQTEVRLIKGGTGDLSIDSSHAAFDYHKAGKVESTSMVQCVPSSFYIRFFSRRRTSRAFR